MDPAFMGQQESQKFELPSNKKVAPSAEEIPEEARGFFMGGKRRSRRSSKKRKASKKAKKSRRRKSSRKSRK